MGGGSLPQGARLNHRARLRRISSSCRHTHCSVLWVHPVQRGGGPTAHTAAESAAVRAQRGTRKRREKDTHIHTHTYTQTHTHTPAALLSKLGLWRDLQRRRSDAGRHGRVFAEGPEQTRGELSAFSGVKNQVVGVMKETMTGSLIPLCYRLRSCC